MTVVRDGLDRVVSTLAQDSPSSTTAFDVRGRAVIRSFWLLRRAICLVVILACSIASAEERARTKEHEGVSWADPKVWPPL